MKKTKENRGITLVALVVTIVVLLILAGVSIRLVLGDNGVVKKAQEAKNKTTEDQANMQAGSNNLDEEIKNKLGELTTNEETSPYFPNATFKHVEGTIETGLVIEDGSGNQFVWIVVPKTKEVYQKTGLGVTSFSETVFNKIEEDLHEYTKTFRQSTTYTDEWSADTTNSDWLSETEYNTAKQNMLKSIYLNGGFYIGRYETGIDPEKEQPRDYGEEWSVLHETTQKPVIKANAYPYTWLRRSQAERLAETFKYQNNGKNYTGSLLFGVQWDLTLAFMKNNNGATGYALIRGSTSVGNYSSRKINVTNANAKYSVLNPVSYKSCPHGKVIGENVLFTTGADVGFSVLNIYDMAGNVWEWTLENTNANDYPCANRGGSFIDQGSSRPMNVRDGAAVYSNAGNNGFRVAIY